MLKLVENKPVLVVKGSIVKRKTVTPRQVYRLILPWEEPVTDAVVVLKRRHRQGDTQKKIV